MLRASAPIIAGLVLLSALTVAAFAAESHFYPSSGSLARVDLLGRFAFPAQGSGSGSAVSGPGGYDTVRALTDDEITFMAHGTIDPDWDVPRHQSGDADRASLAFAEALGSTLQGLASVWDPRLTGVLLWLAFLALMLRPSRLRDKPHATQSDDTHQSSAQELSP